MALLICRRRKAQSVTKEKNYNFRKDFYKSLIFFSNFKK